MPSAATLEVPADATPAAEPEPAGAGAAVDGDPAMSGLADGAPLDTDGPAAGGAEATLSPDRWEEEEQCDDTAVHEAVEIRKCIPIQLASAEGRYLEEQVWPTLAPALEKLLLAVEYNTPKEVKERYPGGLHGPEVRRVTRPEDAEFEPLQWLATYLDNYNPFQPSKFTPDTGALAIQCAWRQFLARRIRGRKTAERDARVSAEALAQRQNAAATTIQALWRGYCVRQEIALGLKGSFRLVSEANG
mmetsp:Transcript_35743/g.93466  ORF Transcript_35743/g.93466 Transcript_35743/m.93466 type:complete len:246 (-) Transcript_35743:10-747(-)